MNIGLYDIKNI